MQPWFIVYGKAIKKNNGTCSRINNRRMIESVGQMSYQPGKTLGDWLNWRINFRVLEWHQSWSWLYWFLIGAGSSFFGEQVADEIKEKIMVSIPSSPLNLFPVRLVIGAPYIVLDSLTGSTIWHESKSKFKFKVAAAPHWIQHGCRFWYSNPWVCFYCQPWLE